MISFLEQIVLSPLMAYLLLGVLLLEALTLIILWMSSKKGVPPFQTVAFLGSGAAFSVALWGFISNFGVAVIAMSLVAAFIFHIFDLWLRWQG